MNTETITRFIGRKKLVLRKNSPHILFVGGLAGMVTSTVLACRATLKLEDTLEEIRVDLEAAKELKTDTANMDDELAKDLVYIYAKSVFKLGRLYGPSLAVGVVSISALSGAHIDLTRRNTALMAAYAAVQKAYDDYRERVIEELGAERELDIYHAKVDTAKDDDGEFPVVDPNKYSPYARFFDEGSEHWKKDAELNRIYVQIQQNWANEMLRARGHLFLNEVYDMLDIERSSAGAVVGWVIGNGDNFVDFGLYEAGSSRFVNGWERTILLDFNVDGVIQDKI